MIIFFFYPMFRNTFSLTHVHNKLVLIHYCYDQTGERDNFNEEHCTIMEDLERKWGREGYNGSCVPSTNSSKEIGSFLLPIRAYKSLSIADFTHLSCSLKILLHRKQ